MLLDEHESNLLDQFEESTIQKKRLLTILWIITGILGFFGGIVLMIIEQIESIGNSREKLIFYFISIGISSIFGLLGYFGFKTRISLNNHYGHKELSKIPTYETYFWMLLLAYFIVLIILLWKEF